MPTSPAKPPADTSRRIYERIRAQILDGTLRAGMPLPSTRAMALDLAVSRTTITTVYEQLAAEGYVETSLGRRARVAAGAAHADVNPRPAMAAPDAVLRLSAYGKKVRGFLDKDGPQVFGADPRVIDFLYGALAFDDFPVLAWRKAYNRALVQRQPSLYYQAPQGELALRVALQGYLRRARGLACHADQILIVHGSQQAIDLCARVLVDADDTVLVEDPCYVMARRLFEAVGADVREVPVDEQGLLSEALPEERTRLVYVTPSHQFPLGGVMPIARRRALLAWAARQRAWIVEDDYDGEFRYGMRPVDTLQSIDDSGAVIYVGTFSKALSPQMRMGYLVLPPSLVSVFREAKRLMDRHAPRLEQAALASLIEDGSYERHVRRCRRQNEARRVALLRALERHLPDAVQVAGSASGLHVVVWVPGVAEADEPELVSLARQHGVGVRPISPLYFKGEAHRSHCCAGLVLGYASLAPAAIDEGVLRLARAIQTLRAGSTAAGLSIDSSETRRA
ncbi:MocR-like pyridoxine biosynthesis transcription factor PdxR [Achromobacter sp. ESBL13]|uniref:MocR-like pyridoxine biosynthesis transcription factor PdxR n=1 Tax=Achromobacter sp. ESBL13 TaxID=3077328 RepID=UPI002FC59773